MHKYYDPKMFHVMSEEEMKLEYAPKVFGDCVLSAEETAHLTPEEKLRQAMDEVVNPEEFIAAGFDVNFVGPGDESVPGSVGEAGLEGEGDSRDDGEQGVMYVDDETFGLWLDSSEFRFGHAVQRWWAGLGSGEEGVVGELKGEDDETHVELFRRIQEDVASEAGVVRGGAGGARLPRAGSS